MRLIDGLHRVTGDPVPDCRGDFLPHAPYNGLPSFMRLDGSYFLWHDGYKTWYISPAKGNTSGPVWFRWDSGMIGDYLWGAGASGTPCVSEV